MSNAQTLAPAVLDVGSLNQHQRASLLQAVQSERQERQNGDNWRTDEMSQDQLNLLYTSLLSRPAQPRPEPEPEPEPEGAGAPAGTAFTFTLWSERMDDAPRLVTMGQERVEVHPMRGQAFTLTFHGEIEEGNATSFSSGAYRYLMDGGNAEFATEIAKARGITSATVTGSGTEADPWVITVEHAWHELRGARANIGEVGPAPIPEPTAETVPAAEPEVALSQAAIEVSFTIPTAGWQDLFVSVDGVRSATSNHSTAEIVRYLNQYEVVDAASVTESADGQTWEFQIVLSAPARIYVKGVTADGEEFPLGLYEQGAYRGLTEDASSPEDDGGDDGADGGKGDPAPEGKGDPDPEGGSEPSVPAESLLDQHLRLVDLGIASYAGAAGGIDSGELAAAGATMPEAANYQLYLNHGEGEYRLVFDNPGTAAKEQTSPLSTTAGQAAIEAALEAIEEIQDATVTATARDDIWNIEIVSDAGRVLEFNEWTLVTDGGVLGL